MVSNVFFLSFFFLISPSSYEISDIDGLGLRLLRQFSGMNKQPARVPVDSAKGGVAEARLSGKNVGASACLRADDG